MAVMGYNGDNSSSLYMRRAVVSNGYRLLLFVGIFDKVGLIWYNGGK